MANILVVDDDQFMCQMLLDMGSAQGHQVAAAHTLADGTQMARTGNFDLVLLDVMMPDGNGLEALPVIRSVRSSPEVIIITAVSNSQGAELAIKSGAWDYIHKPAVLNEISLPISRALQYRLAAQRTRPSVSLKRLKIVGSSPQILQCLDLLTQSANSDASILIVGETGAGKEELAATIHENSPRHQRSFVVVDCSTLPESLVESALFGHEKGAFTGADQQRDGLIKAADGGTLFLDEVGELSLSVQRAFLRVLQERSFRPVGALKEISSDFRLVAATNRDLDQMVKEGRFREDLLFRLRTFCISVPPLRDRRQDILPLMTHFMTQFHERYGEGIKGFSPEFLEAVAAYSWPGNVRELKSALESACVVARGLPTLLPIHLPTDIRIQLKREFFDRKSSSPMPPVESPQSCTMPLPLAQHRRYTEKKYFLDLIQYTKGNLDEACQMAGLSRSRLYALLQRNRISLKKPPEKAPSVEIGTAQSGVA